MKRTFAVCTHLRDISLDTLRDVALGTIQTGTMPDGFFLTEDGDQSFTPVAVPPDHATYNLRSTVDGRFLLA